MSNLAICSCSISQRGSYLLATGRETAYSAGKGHSNEPFLDIEWKAGNEDLLRWKMSLSIISSKQSQRGRPLRVIKLLESANSRKLDRLEND